MIATHSSASFSGGFLSFSLFLLLGSPRHLVTIILHTSEHPFIPLTHTCALPSVVDSLERMTCRHCGGPLVRQASQADSSSQDQTITHHTPRRVHPLPSEHWLELTDLWVCAQLAPAMPADEIRAAPGQFLIGAHHVLMHPDDLASERVRVGSREALCHREEGEEEEEVGEETAKCAREAEKAALSMLEEEWAVLECRQCGADIGSALIPRE